MGDPRKQKKSYDTPMHPWQRERIDAEKQLIKEYGLKNKQEVWKYSTRLKKYIKQYKDTSIGDDTQSVKERADLMNHMLRMGIIKKGAADDEILGLHVRSVLDRRLQTVVLKKKLAHTMKQARQFITHRHIKVGEKVITSPSYMVPLEQEAMISFVARSPMFKEDHPERVREKEEKAPKMKKEKAVEEQDPVAEDLAKAAVAEVAEE